MICCDNCSHAVVCAFKKDVLDVSAKVDSIDKPEILTLDLDCRHRSVIAAGGLKYENK